MWQHRPHNLRKTGPVISEKADKPGNGLTPVVHKLKHQSAVVISEEAERPCKHLFLLAVNFRRVCTRVNNQLKLMSGKGRALLKTCSMDRWSSVFHCRSLL